MSSKPNDVLQIKKYPNRRYYDATRSCHVTLNDIYDLIRAGHRVRITESRDSEDITNLVLMQILLEKDQPKLDVFPPMLLHQVIFSNIPALRASIERLFGPLSRMMAGSQQQFDAFWRQVFPGQMTNPTDWTNAIMGMMSPGQPGQTQEPPPKSPVGVHETDPPPDETGEFVERHQPTAPPSNESINEMREQIAELNSRLERLSTASIEEQTNQDHA